jgi:enhancing lycopene biosynthesis protein 2
MARKKVGLLLSGCGVQDGSEIHEAVLTLLALDRADVEIVFVAPDIGQSKVTNHATGNDVPETRNVLVESARIARGKVVDLAGVKGEDLDGVALPGGFGAALNLCTFGKDGPKCSVNPEVERLLKEMHAAGKPILALCIAPALIARVLGSAHVRVTIGNDADTAAAIEALGAKHEACAVDKWVVDSDHKIVTTPAYMLATRISEVAAGIDAAVQAFTRLL